MSVVLRCKRHVHVCAVHPELDGGEGTASFTGLAASAAAVTRDDAEGSARLYACSFAGSAFVYGLEEEEGAEEVRDGAGLEPLRLRRVARSRAAGDDGRDEL